MGDNSISNVVHKDKDDLWELYKEKFLKEPTLYVDLLETETPRGVKRCINPNCESEEEYVQAPNIARLYYNMGAGGNAVVCKECLKKAVKFCEDIEDQILEEKSICNIEFPLGMEVIVVDDDEEDDTKRKKQKKMKDNNSQDISAIMHFSKHLLDNLSSKNCIKGQMNDAIKCLESEVKDCEGYCKEIETSTSVMCEELDKCMRKLYDVYSIRSESLPTFEVPYEEMRPEYLRLSYLNDENDCTFAGNVTESAPVNLPPSGIIQYPELKVGDKVYVMRVSVFSEWVPAIIEDFTTRTVENVRDIKTYKVVITNEDTNKIPSYKRDISPQLIAYYDPPTVRLDMGTRIIAEFCNKAKNFVKLFSGMVAEVPTHLNHYRYLVFFDDGHAQYVNHSAIRLVCESKPNSWEHFNPKVQHFIKRYVMTFPERAMLKVKNLDCVKTEHKGMWVNARVVEVDCSLIHLLFLHDKHYEWLYRGSTRLYPMFQGLNPKRLRGNMGRPRSYAVRKTGPNSLYVHYDTVSLNADDEVQNGRQLDSSRQDQMPARAVARKSSTRLPEIIEKEDIRNLYERRVNRYAYQEQAYGRIEQRQPPFIIRPKCFRPHLCDINCVNWIKTKLEDTKGINPLAAPVLFGFVRETDIMLNIVSYVAPCGRKLRSINEVFKYLNETALKISIDMFDFDSKVNIFNEFVVPEEHARMLPDLSFGVENIPIVVINAVDGQIPTYMDYMVQRRATEGVKLNLDPEFLVGCDCTDSCQDKTKCACWQLTLSNNFEGRGTDNVGYHYKRLGSMVPTGIYECNSRCKCCHETCLNRVVQHPLKLKLQLFMTKNKGWGTRALNDIPSGTFICVYVGNIYTEDVANVDGKLYGDEYFAELDYIEVCEASKEGYEEFVDPNEYLNVTQNNILVEPHSDEEFESAETSPITGLSMNLRKRNPKKSQADGSDEEDDPEAVEFGSDIGEGDGPNMDVDRGESVNSDGPKYTSVREYYGKNESVYIMDAKSAGNIGRYLNHSCDPNIFVQNVFVDTHDLRFPWVAFFSLKYITAGTELTWDYRYEVGSVPGKNLKCYCGSDNCRGRLL